MIILDEIVLVYRIRTKLVESVGIIKSKLGRENIYSCCYIGIDAIDYRLTTNHRLLLVFKFGGKR